MRNLCLFTTLDHESIDSEVVASPPIYWCQSLRYFLNTILGLVIIVNEFSYIGNLFLAQFDVYYVGTILPKEVTFTNLNDNINSDFIRDMCEPFGPVEDAKVYFHPVTKKHLNIGKV